MKALVTGGGTGGHLMPALALAEALRDLGVTVKLVGAQRGIESKVLPERDFDYELLSLHPIYRRQIWKNIGWLGWAPATFLASRRVVTDFEPDVLVGTGGYAAGPLTLVARMRGIPIVLQEQNALPGLTTRFASRWAAQVHLGFPEAASRLRARPGVVHNTGNPISPPKASDRRIARTALGLDPDNTVVAVSGGSQGSRALNRVVAAAIESGSLDGVTLLWGVGHLTYPEFKKYHAPPQRLLRPFWDPMAELYGAADLIVGRAGAMSVAEFCAWGLPSVLVPLPSAAADHQTSNARAMEAAGAAIHIPERELSPRLLAETLAGLLADRDRLEEMAGRARDRGKPEAAAEIAADIVSLVG